MSWNNSKETIKFRKELKAMIEYWPKHGMSVEQIRDMVAYETEQFHKKRNQYEYGEEVSLYTYDEDGNEELIYHESLISVDDYSSDPLTFGFEDSRLNDIWFTLTDEIDKAIFKLLYEGKTQCEISVIVGISQQAISKRISGFQKKP